MESVRITNHYMRASAVLRSISSLRIQSQCKVGHDWLIIFLILSTVTVFQSIMDLDISEVYYRHQIHLRSNAGSFGYISDSVDFFPQFRR